MRVLRLSNSDDLNPAIPLEQRASSIASEQLERATGEQVETIVKPIWPTDDLAPRIERWLQEFEPDLVFLKVSWYWYGYESVPLRVERLLGPLGKPLAKLGVRAAESHSVGHSHVFKALRRWTHRVIGGDTNFSPEHVLRVMDEVIRTVLAHEDVVLVVKGTGAQRDREDPAVGYYAERFQQKRVLVEGTLERRCREQHIAWTDTSQRVSREDRDLDNGDGVHKGHRGQRQMGTKEGAAMVDAWFAAHGQTASSRAPEAISAR